ncbi:beta-galactosidase, partial [Enterococcus faecium]
LLAVKDQMTTAQETMYPLTMEEAGPSYGYMLYSVNLKNYHHENKLKVVEASDRLHLFVDGSLQTIQYQETLGEEVMING